MCLRNYVRTSNFASMTARPSKTLKNTNLPSDLVEAVELFLITRKRKNGNTITTFSGAVAQGLRLLLSHHKTSVPKLTKQIRGGQQ